MRIVLTADDFRTLVSGGVVRIRPPAAGPVYRAGPFARVALDLALEDIGVDVMLGAIGEVIANMGAVGNPLPDSLRMVRPGPDDPPGAA